MTGPSNFYNTIQGGKVVSQVGISVISNLLKVWMYCFNNAEVTEDFEEWGYVGRPEAAGAEHLIASLCFLERLCSEVETIF